MPKEEITCHSPRKILFCCFVDRHVAFLDLLVNSPTSNKLYCLIVFFLWIQDVLMNYGEVKIEICERKNDKN